MTKFRKGLNVLMLGFIFAHTIAFIGCADLNIEVQQTQRVHSSASRNPITENSDMQGSTRTQGKSPSNRLRLDAENTEAIGETPVFGSDVSGEEK